MWNHMKALKGRYLWLLLSLGLLGGYRLAIRSSTAANQFTAVTQKAKDFLGRLCQGVPFSVMECLIVVLVVLLLSLLVLFLRRLHSSPQKGKTLYTGLLTALCLFLTGWGLYSLLWGVNYYADGFQEKSGVYARPVSAQELDRVTTDFVQRLQELADQVERDEEGVFAVPRDAILDAAPQVYTNLSREFPFLAREDARPKPMFFSKIFSAMGFTGFYSPFTGESNLNVDSPACLLPANIAHELGHQRGIASEQECNFLAVAAALSSDDPVYQYSGCLMAYIHLGNALYRADRDRWQQVYASLPEPVLRDLRAHSAYWEQYKGMTATVSKKVYDTALKAYGQEDGIRSYGTCVDLLVAYY